MLRRAHVADLNDDALVVLVALLVGARKEVLGQVDVEPRMVPAGRQPKQGREAAT